MVTILDKGVINIPIKSKVVEEAVVVGHIRMKLVDIHQHNKRPAIMKIIIQRGVNSSKIGKARNLTLINTTMKVLSSRDPTKAAVLGTKKILRQP